MWGKEGARLQPCENNMNNWKKIAIIVGIVVIVGVIVLWTKDNWIGVVNNALKAIQNNIGIDKHVFQLPT